MSSQRRPGYIEKFLKRADKAVDSAIEQGVRRADEILGDAVELGKITAGEAQRRSEALRGRAEAEARKLKAGGERRLGGSITAAKRIRGGDAIDTIARLGELKKAGIITDAEFRAKKKKLLAGI